MGLFDKLFKKEEEVLPELNVDDSAIVAIADGELIDIKSVPDPVFAEEMMGKSTAFKYNKDKVTLCSPANGTLGVLFPTGHAFGIVTNEGVEILIHCGVDTVNANGDGFKLLKKKQGDTVKAGDPIVEVDIKKLSANYDMSTMLIITNPNEKVFEFIEPQAVKRGQSVVK
ncbi:MAG: PTS glucose transporter subunit IIA [Erysipelotrichaceae bacterium]|nr:PTS glucose transporter subunit IIA [Erysipelotrichaceae bacterium]MBR6957058.1 PTS glucose transporter subunit IIA [Erysipelotrichaceae bacterium]